MSKPNVYCKKNGRKMEIINHSIITVQASVSGVWKRARRRSFVPWSPPFFQISRVQLVGLVGLFFSFWGWILGCDRTKGL